MKKIFTFVLLITALIACDENTRIPEFKNALNFRMQIRPTNNFFDISAIETAKLVMDIYSENYNEIETVQLRVRWQKAGNPACASGGCLGPFEVKTFTKSEMAAGKGAIEGYEITSQELVEILGITLADLNGGDQFFFENITTMTNGVVYPTFINGVSNVPAIYATPGASYTSAFTASVGCPFVVADMVGAWTLTADDWEVASIPVGSTINIVAGTAANTLVIQNIFGFGFNLNASVNPASGAVTVTKQETWTPTYWGYPASYGKGYATADVGNGSLAFSCIGKLNFKFSYTVDAGSFAGVHNYSLAKQ